MKLRQLGEAFAKHAAASCGLYAGPEANQLDVLRGLEANRIVEGRTRDLFHTLRRAGNRVTHEFTADHRLAMDQLKIARQLAIWFHRTFGGPGGKSFKAEPFIAPEDPDARQRAAEQEVARLRAELAASAEKLRLKDELAQAEAEQRTAAEQAAQRAETERAEWEKLAGAFEKDLNDAQAQFETLLATEHARVAQTPEQPETQIEVANASAEADATLELDEDETRVLIDEQLRQAGWEADSKAMRYTAGARPQKGKNRAIAEWPTETGPADYVLFIGLVPVAIVEAKRKHKDIPGALEQAKRYAVGLKLASDHRYAPGAQRWLSQADSHSIIQDTAPTAMTGAIGWYAREEAGALLTYRVPYAYATNGRDYHRQRKTESGIWFIDTRRPTNIARAIMGWHSPDALWRELQSDADEAAAKLDGESFSYTGLRAYQCDAVRAVERAMASGQREILVAMATGTGKTRTTIGLIYRLLKAGLARRVLFLVDRKALGEQAENAFKEMRLEQDRTFSETYNVSELRDLKPDASTRVQIATVQSMVRRVLVTKDGDEHLAVDAFDVVVVDESHRGYNLDREMTEGELELRTVTDYISMYRRVLDYFDAVKVGLTATPAAHTTDIFGAPVYTYSYREAVIDGYLIDHEPPVRIITKLAKKGIDFPAGTDVKVLKPGGVTKVEQMADDLKFDVAAFNRFVISDEFTRVVCETLAADLDPNKPEKTLIYCVTDKHADDVVAGLKLALQEQWGVVEDNAVLKITGATDKYLAQIRRYKNEKLPNIAVTVDLLTTGIDVPEICNLVFIRRVNSRILYEQMLGRATRRCDKIGKEVFRIYDAVDLYAALEDVSQMKPVVTQVNTSLDTLFEDLQNDVSFEKPGSEADRSHADDVLDQLVVRIRRAVQRLQGLRQPPESLTLLAEALATNTGGDLAELPAKLRAMSAEDARAFVADRPTLPKLLNDFFEALRGTGNDRYISTEPDTLDEVGRGYGAGAKPEDYLEAFRAYIKANENEFDALKVVLTRPRNLTRQQLKELRTRLYEANFNEAQLRAAWRDAKNVDIAASIIGFIRQQALGSPLMPYAERVKRAKAKVLTMHPWTPGQRGWLERIANQLETEVIVDREAFEVGAFRTQGGYKQIDKRLDGKLDQVLGRIRRRDLGRR